MQNWEETDQERITECSQVSQTRQTLAWDILRIKWILQISNYLRICQKCLKDISLGKDKKTQLPYVIRGEKAEQEKAGHIKLIKLQLTGKKQTNKTRKNSKAYLEINKTLFKCFKWKVIA